MIDRPNANLSFSRFIGHQITTRKEMLKKVYQKFSPGSELEFVSESLSYIAENVGTFGDLLKQLLQVEFEICDFEGILRRNSLSTKILDYFMRKSGRFYLAKVLREPILLVMQDGKIGNLEIKISNLMANDPKRTEQKKPKKKGGTFTFGRKNRQNPFAKQAKKNSKKLLKYFNLFCEFIFSEDSLQLMPAELRVVARYIHDLAVTFEHDPIPRVGSLLLLRFVNPAICLPEKKEVLPIGTKVSGTQRRAFMLITKLIQCLSNRKASLEKDLDKLSEKVLDKWLQRSDAWLKDICMPTEFVNSQEDSLTALKRKNTSIKTKEFNEVTLLLFYFLKSRNLSEIHYPMGVSRRLKHGTIVFCSIAYIVEKQIDTHLKFCHEDFYQSETLYESFTEKMIQENEGDQQAERGSFFEKEIAPMKKVTVNFCKVKCGEHLVYVTAITTGPFSDFVIHDFLVCLSKEWDVILSENRGTYENAFFLMSSLIDEYNKGKKIDVEYFNEKLKMILKQSVNKFKKPELERASSFARMTKRTQFRHIPVFQELVKEYANKE